MLTANCQKNELSKSKGKKGGIPIKERKKVEKK